jgi:para-aminobenzoate synthetase/4-amino-4-deoxychorismate lyase
MDATEPGTALIVDSRTSRLFTAPQEIVTTNNPQVVQAALHHIDLAVAGGHTAVGFLSYEAAPAFDEALRTHLPDGPPLLWFGLYEGENVLSTKVPTHYQLGDWTAGVSEAEYHCAIARIHEYIAAGDTYQVNYTFPLHAAFEGDGLAWFRDLCAAQRPGRHGDQRIYIDTGPFQILSISPELFFTLDGYRLTTRPMKGTRRRGRWSDEDQQLAKELAQSAKDQAENVMIVDMIRNDLGRVSETGTVRVDELFAVERYETVWQMTSTIASECHASLPEIFAALFPSASVTGAPKVRTMQIIRELEQQPRGVYCGAIGWWGPGRQAKFSVPIRTATIDRAKGLVRYPVGSGVTWDSSPAGEYQECLDKAAILARPRPEFDLLETMLWDGKEIFLLQRHLDRLAASSAYFGRPFDRDTVQGNLVATCAQTIGEPRRIRLLLDATGTARMELHPLNELKPLKAAFAPKPVDPNNIFLYHKTTYRHIYDEARAACPQADEVILWNTRGELSECTFGNLVLEIDGRRYTPPVRCGLLPGTYRAELLKRGEIEERLLTRDAVTEATRLWMINAVRKNVPLELCHALLNP